MEGTLVKVHPDTVNSRQIKGEPYKEIDKLQIGDLVLSANEHTGELSYRPVTELFVHDVKLIHRLTYKEGLTIETTWNHPFWVQDKGWTEAKDLHAGERSVTARSILKGKQPKLQTVSFTSNVQPGFDDPSLVTWDDAKEGTLAVAGVEEVHRADKVYNIEVEGNHTYFVTEEGVLVHNYEMREFYQPSAEHIARLILSSDRSRKVITELLPAQLRTSRDLDTIVANMERELNKDGSLSAADKAAVINEVRRQVYLRDHGVPPDEIWKVATVANKKEFGWEFRDKDGKILAYKDPQALEGLNLNNGLLDPFNYIPAGGGASIATNVLRKGAGEAEEALAKEVVEEAAPVAKSILKEIWEWGVGLFTKSETVMKQAEKEAINEATRQAEKRLLGKVVGDLSKISKAEREMALELAGQGRVVEIVARVPGQKTPDFLIDGVRTELKSLTASGANTLKNAIQTARKQGEHILIDARSTSYSKDEILRQINLAAKNYSDIKNRVIVLTRDGIINY